MITKIQKIKNYILSHKIISIVVIVLIIIFAFVIKKMIVKAAPTQYVTEEVSKGSIVETVTGSGQVSASNQIDLKPQNNGTIVYVGVKAGEVVPKGKLLFSLDAKSAQKAVRDAEINLQNAELSLEKFQVENSTENMNADVQKTYDDAFSAVSSTFLDLSTTLNGINDILSKQNLSDNFARGVNTTAVNYKNNASDSYYKAQNAFYKNNADWRLISINSSHSQIENILNETDATTQLLSEALKNTKTYVDYMSYETDRTSDYNSYNTSLSQYITSINSHLSSLSSSITNIKNSKDTVSNNGIDTQTQELSVVQRQNALQDAKDNLSDYYVVAPFDGTIASVSAKVGDVSSGTLGTIITKQKIASISFNEVDIAKIKLGQKATLTFDAIDELVITGTVSEIDSIGTVSQGVVSYNVNISMDIDDARIKPGMSVSATVITNTAQDVLLVPNSAIKTVNGSSYVETFQAPLSTPESGAQGSVSSILPTQVQVETGLSDDTNTEIINGLKEGDIVVTKTISSSTSKTSSQTPTIFNAVGGNKGSGTNRPVIRSGFGG